MHYQIIYNAVKCPDGTILESHHRHDYKCHRDIVTNETIFIDGGHDYLRRSINKVPATELSIDTSYPFEEQRKYFSWGSYGKNGNEAKHYIKLKDVTDNHIKAIMTTQLHIRGTFVETLFKNEVEYRKINNIEVNE